MQFIYITVVFSRSYTSQELEYEICAWTERKITKLDSVSSFKCRHHYLISLIKTSYQAVRQHFVGILNQYFYSTVTIMVQGVSYIDSVKLLLLLFLL